MARPAWLAIMGLMSVAACGNQRPFDAAMWKADRLSDSHLRLEARRSMLDDLARRFPPGTPKSTILAQLGPGEERLDCPYPDADSCLAYDLGMRSIDYDYFEFRFRRDRLVESHVRPS